MGAVRTTVWAENFRHALEASNSNYFLTERKPVRDAGDEAVGGGEVGWGELRSLGPWRRGEAVGAVGRGGVGWWRPQPLPHRRQAKVKGAVRTVWAGSWGNKCE